MVLVKPIDNEEPDGEKISIVEEQAEKFERLKEYWGLSDAKYILQYYWDNEIIIDEEGLIYAEIVYESDYEHYENYGDHEND